MFKRLRVLVAFATVAALALSVSARAQQAPGEPPGTASRHQAASPKAQPADGAVEVDSRMAEIEAALDKSEALMQRVGMTSEPAERARLFREHGQAVRETVGAIRAIAAPFSREMRRMMGGGKRAVSSDAMMRAHALIARRIALMDRMMAQIMEQLMGHQEASGKPRAP